MDRLRALLLVLPPTAVVGFHTAAQLYGFGVLPSDRLHVVVPAGTPVPDYRGVAAHQSVLPFDDPVDIAGVPCLPPERCAIDIARTCRRLDSLAVVDAALRAERVSEESLAVEVRRHDGLRGVRQARDVVPLADPRAECLQESQLRLIMTDGGLPRPELQVWIVDDWGIPRYRSDLGYPAFRIGGEYDGVSHLDRQRMRQDRERQNWLSAHGWTMRYFTDIDIYRRPHYVVSAMREALRRAGAA